MSEALHIVLAEFPDADKMIRHLYAKDEDFKQLCRDYKDASKAIAIWQQSITTEAPKRTSEYQLLVEELQKDIRHYLEKAKLKQDISRAE